MNSNRVKRYIRRRHIAERLGEVSRVTTWRQEQDDPRFPKPDMYVGNIALYDEAKFDAYVDILKSEAPKRAAEMAARGARLKGTRAKARAARVRSPISKKAGGLS